MDWYCLYKNGRLNHTEICPDPAPANVVKIWIFNANDRLTAWDIVIEALAMGANQERIKGLSNHWEIHPTDLAYYYHNRRPNDIRKLGAKMWAELMYGGDLGKSVRKQMQKAEDDHDRECGCGGDDK